MFKQILIIGLAALGLSHLALAEMPNYDFAELKKVSSIREADINGWSQINDQVLLISRGASRHYLFVLDRPNHDLAFSSGLGVSSSTGRVSARFDKVYSSHSKMVLPSTIKFIYEVKGKEQLAAAKALVETEEARARKATQDERKAKKTEKASAKPRT